MFDIEKFKIELHSNIDKKEAYCYSSFHETFTSLPHQYVSIKKKILGCNKNLYMTKTLRKTIMLIIIIIIIIIIITIMLRSKLKTKYNKTDQLKTWIITKAKETFV